MIKKIFITLVFCTLFLHSYSQENVYIHKIEMRQGVKTDVYTIDYNNKLDKVEQQFSKTTFYSIDGTTISSADLATHEAFIKQLLTNSVKAEAAAKQNIAHEEEVVVKLSENVQFTIQDENLKSIYKGSKKMMSKISGIFN